MSSAHIIGVDVGGTNIKISRFHSSTWTVLKHAQVPTPLYFPEVLDACVELIESFRTDATTPVGVCFPGPIRQAEGILVRAPNILDSEEVPVKKILSERLKTNVEVENDGQAFTLAEATLGAGKGYPVVCGVIIGTGLGGGLVVNGKVYEGANGFAGEIGHMLLQPGQPPYETKNNRGDAEQFLSGTAFAERCKAAVGPEDYLEGDVCAALHPDVIKEVAWLCTNITHAYDPSIIIFGGSIGKALNPHLMSIKEELTKWILPPIKSPVLAIAKMEHPGTLGAALIAKQ